VTAIRLGLRLGRWGLLGFGAVGFIATFINAVGFYAVAGHTQAEREAFARSFAQIAAQLTVLLPPPTRLDTVARLRAVPRLRFARYRVRDLGPCRGHRCSTR